MKDIDINNRFDNLETKLEKTKTELKEDIESVKKRVSNIEVKLSTHDRRFDSIEEKVSLIPKLYDNVDKLVGEIVENRQERVFINQRLADHEKRITNIECIHKPKPKP